MRIGLISDTHVPVMGAEPPPQVVRAFEGVDLILHAGDIYAPSCLEWLGRIAPVRATESWQGDREGVGRGSEPRVVEAGGHFIGLVHALWLPGISDEIVPGIIERELRPGVSLPTSLLDIFGKRVDIVVFGYTHVAMVETHQGVLFVNPGSTTLVRQLRRLGSVAILDLTAESRKAWIVDLARLAA